MSTPRILPVIEHISAVYKTWFEYRNNIPKSVRYTLGERVDARFIQVLELLFVASYQSKAEKIPTLDRALVGIDTLKFLLRLTWEIGVLDNKKYAYLSEGLDKVGRETGGWRKGLQSKTPANAGESR